MESDAVLIVNLSGRMIGTRARQLGERLSKLKESGIDNVILNFGEVTSIDSLAVLEISSAIESGMNVSLIHPNYDCVEFLQKSRCQAAVYQDEAAARRNIEDSGKLLKEQKRQGWNETDIPATFEYDGKNIRGTLLKISKGVALVAHKDDLLGQNVSGSITVAVHSRKLGPLHISGTVEWTRKIGEVYNIGVRISQEGGVS